MSVLFICYRRAEDPAMFQLLVERLRQRFGDRLFVDHDGIPGGADFPALLGRKLAEAFAYVVVIGPRWLELLRERREDPHDYVREEVAAALASGRLVLPVLVGGAPMPSSTDLADFPELVPLATRDARSLRAGASFDADMKQLLDALEQGREPVDRRVLAGRYKLLERIGVGGMGEVWVAEDLDARGQKVAVKLVRSDVDSREFLARFDAERQALALMNHDGVARYCGHGEDPHGHPFIAIELVPGGVPITEYCDSSRLPLPDRLHLFIAVCGAVLHAHQKGVIHRDLKPANILVTLVDGKPKVKVIDFGVAKAAFKLTDRTLYTIAGQLLGTPEYMSPEQAKGSNDLDVRADVYALGVLLYELIAGAPPFLRGDNLQELLQRIETEEPPKPSDRVKALDAAPRTTIAAKRRTEAGTLTGQIRGDLDWIVLKCLGKKPDSRYETAKGLARDIERHLANEPVSAVSPSTWYRFNKFLRRNRVIVFPTTVILVMAVIAAAFILKAAADKRTADAQSEAALQFIERHVFGAVRAKGAGGLGLDAKLSDAIRAAIPFVATECSNSPLLEARIRMSIADALWRLGDARVAKLQYERALTLFERELGESHEVTLRCMTNLAASYSDAGELDKALGDARKSAMAPQPKTRRRPSGYSLEYERASSHLSRFGPGLRCHQTS